MNLKTTTKKIVATVALAGAVTAGTAGAAFAADGSSSTANADGAAQVAKHPRLALRRALGGVVSEALGVSRADLRAALKGGQSVNEYAASLNKDPQVVVDAVTNAVNTRLDEAVANGKISAERAATIKSKVPARIAKAMDHHFGQHA
ncbi:MAG: hypothetical protein ABW073_00790 [Acidimicrobiia bacterium]